MKLTHWIRTPHGGRCSTSAELPVELVRQAQRELPAKVTTFERLVELHHGMVVRLAQGVLTGTEGVDDVAQEVWIRVFRNLRRLQDPSRFTGWLGRITVNCATTQLRRAIREREKCRTYGELADPEHALSEEAQSYDPSSARSGGLFETLLTRLTAAESQVLREKLIDELGFDEIAERLGLKSSTVKMRYYRALEKLRGPAERMLLAG